PDVAELGVGLRAPVVEVLPDLVPLALGGGVGVGHGGAGVDIQVGDAGVDRLHRVEVRAVGVVRVGLPVACRDQQGTHGVRLAGTLLEDRAHGVGPLPCQVAEALLGRGGGGLRRVVGRI